MDEIFIKICDILVEKVKFGVEVRFMFDGFGLSKFYKVFLVFLKEVGVSIYVFDLIIFLWIVRIVNLWNYCKIVVIDG